MRIPGENRAKLRKLFNLIRRLRWGAKYPIYTEYSYYFLIKINLYSSDVSIKKKYSEHQTFIVTYSISLGLFWKYWISINEDTKVLKWLSKCANVIVKIRCCFSFTINLQLKLSKNQHTILETFTKKNLLWNLTRFYGGLFELEILETFTLTFSLGTIIRTWIFFQALQNTLLKGDLLKKDASHLKIPWHNKRQKKEKRKITKSQTTTINIIYFYFWFSLNNSETVKAVALAFCNIQ